MHFPSGLAAPERLKCGGADPIKLGNTDKQMTMEVGKKGTGRADAGTSQPSSTIVEQITQRLGWEIVFRKIPPGARLREHELAERYEISRPVVREILPKLEVQGLVEIVPWKGARVPILTRTQLSDLFEFYALVFGFSVRIATERATSEQLASVERSVEKLERLAASDASPEHYELARAEAHATISQSMGETTVLMQRRPLVGRVRHQFVLDAIRTVEQRHASAQRWRTLYRYMTVRDALGAEAHAKAMVLTTREPALKAHSELVQTPATKSKLS